MLVHLFKKQELSCRVQCLQRNTCSNLHISTGFHFSLGQVIYKHKVNDNRLAIAQVTAEQEKWLLATCFPCACS